jgi:hypothetical protein
MQSYVASIVSEKFKVKYVAQNPAKGWEDSRHYFVSDPFQYIDGFDNHYLDKEYDLDLEDKMREFLRDFEEKGKEPSTMKYVKSIPKLDIKWLLAGFFFSCFPKYNDKNDYINYRGYRAFFDRFMFYFRYQIGKKYYSMPSLDRKYVYFPLHYQPEASTLVCASKYEKQLFYIDSLAKSLPGDTLLYVKEHYALLGSRKLKFYRELKQYPNVILVNPLVSSRKLIENAEVVVTLTGSAGWEAMLLRKPVIVSGNVFYENAPGVLKVQDIYMNYIDAIRSWRRPARSDIVKYLCEYYINSFDGSAYFPAKTNLNRVNMHEIAISLINYVSSHSELN